jgi:type I restriction enzyme S subunit
MGDEAVVVGGGTPSTKDPSNYEGGEVPWITPADLSGYTDKHISHGRRNITEKGLKGSGARMLPAGSLLFSSRAPIGYIAIAKNPVSTNQGFKSFVPNGTLSSDYLYYYLKRAKDLALALASGTTFLEVSGKKVREIAVPVPPLEEQEQIVAEIETQFARLDDAVAALERARTRLKRYRASVLKAACEGRLVQGPKLTDWPIQQLGEHIERMEAGKNFRCDERPPKTNEVGIVKISAVTWGVFNEQESKTCYDNSSLRDELLIQPGDFLFSRANTIELVGACVIVRDVTLPLMLSDKVLRITFGPDLDQRWALHFLRSAQGRNEIESRATGNQNSMRNIGQKRIKEIPIPVPPLEAQRKIIEEIERRFSVIEQLDLTVETNLKRTEALRQSILRMAFSGRLVSTENQCGKAAPRVVSDQDAVESLRSTGAEND